MEATPGKTTRFYHAPALEIVLVWVQRKNMVRERISQAVLQKATAVTCDLTIPFFRNSHTLEAVLNLIPPKDMVKIADHPTHLPKTIVRDLKMT